ncbi:MAG: NIPSNAP family protein [Acidobacteria bacterium]|nr:NIPSNAP family protein [Acidobacteriota bacterium]
MVELRQYTLKPGQRDTLIDIFDREFIETQEAVGMRVVGEFRDEDNPDHFVWLRGFADMDVRKQGLTAFYSGPAWKTFGKQAAATMIDSDNVLLLRPSEPAQGFVDLPASRPPVDAVAQPGYVIVTIYHLKPSTAAAFPNFFRAELRPALRAGGIVPRAAFETEHSANNYPALPIREGENVYVWFASYESSVAYADALGRLERARNWNESKIKLQSFLDAPTQVLRLTPTVRSLLR